MLINKTIITSIILFISSLVLRIYYINNTIFSYPGFRGDEIHYFNYAMNLAEKGIFSLQSFSTDIPIPDSYRPPGFPSLIAIILKLVGNDNIYFPIMYTQAVLGALTAVVVFLFGQTYLPYWAGITAAVLFSLEPHSITIGNNLLTETLFGFLLILALYLYCHAARSLSLVTYFFSGLVFGAAYLTNPVVLFLPFLLVSVKILRNYYFDTTNPKATNYLLTIFLCAFVIFPVSWSIRNAISVPESALTSGRRLIENFVVGSHSNYYDIWRADPRDPQNPATLDMAKINYQWLPYLKIWFSRFIDNPIHYLEWYFLEKPRLLWSWDILTGIGDIYIYEVITSPYSTSKIMMLSCALMKALHPWSVVFALIGFFVIFFRNLKDEVEFYQSIYLSLAYLSSVYIVLQSEARYSFPLRPELYLATLLCISSIIHWYQNYVERQKRLNR